MAKIKKGDDVIVRTGKDKGKSGRVTKVLKGDKVLVEGINQVKKNQKPNPMREFQEDNCQGYAINISNIDCIILKRKKQIESALGFWKMERKSDILSQQTKLLMRKVQMNHG